MLRSVAGEAVRVVPYDAAWPRLFEAERALVERVLAPWASPINASLAFAVAYLLLWWGAMWLLDRAGIRVRA